jgi:hypothetical protein
MIKLTQGTTVMKNCEPFVLGPAFAVHKNIGSPEKQGEL